ncbi:hypothetical protein DFH06DRAFT_1126263 [Mycena polygramma]|nr:hypothetical protein DFH06DRAFT_1126263 [Mycena polygramma]
MYFAVVAGPIEAQREQGSAKLMRFETPKSAAANSAIGETGKLTGGSNDGTISDFEILPPPDTKTKDGRRRLSEGTKHLLLISPLTNLLAQCYNPPGHSSEGGRTYYHHFTDADADSSTSSTSAVSSSIPPSEKCRYTSGGSTCTSGRTNKHCSNRMCQKHCVKTGGCAYTRHHASTSSNSISIPAHVPLAAPSLPRPISAAPSFSRPVKSLPRSISAATSLPRVKHTAPSLSLSVLAASSSRLSSPQRDHFPSAFPAYSDFSAFASYDELLQSAQEPLDRLNKYQDPLAAALDLTFGSFSPSPERSLEDALRHQEEQELAQALRLSARETQQASRHAKFEAISAMVSRPSPPPVPTLRLRSLSPSPDPPTSILPAASTQARTTVSRPPPSHKPPVLTITKQLSDDWVKPSSSTFHISHASRKPIADVRVGRRFMIVYLGDATDEPVVLCLSADDIPDWPKFQLSESPSTVQDLGIDDLDDLSLQQYSTTYEIFMNVSVRHLFTVTTDCVLFFRRKGVRVANEADLLTRFFPAQTVNHQRHGLSQERAGVRAEYKKLKGKGKTISPLSESDSEVEASEVVPAAPVVRKRPFEEDGASRQKRPRLAVNTNVVEVHDDDDGDDDTPSTLASTSTSTSASTSTKPSDKGTWMKGMYVKDMVAGFARMDSKELAHLSKAERFHAVFGAFRFTPSTYDDQCRRWRSASHEERQKALDAGRTDEGLWQCRKIQICLIRPDACIRPYQAPASQYQAVSGSFRQRQAVSGLVK